MRGHYADARQVLSDLQALGVDYRDVTSVLENNGLAAFDASWQELGDQLAVALRRPAGRDQAGHVAGIGVGRVLDRGRSP